MMEHEQFGGVGGGSGPMYEIGRRVMSIEDLFQWHQILNYNGNG